MDSVVAAPGEASQHCCQVDQFRLERDVSLLRGRACFFVPVRAAEPVHSRTELTAPESGGGSFVRQRV